MLRPPLRRPTKATAILFGAIVAIALIASLTIWRLDENWTGHGPHYRPGLLGVNGSIDVSLRIMPMGASTIIGEQNEGDYGFRKSFRDQLVAAGAQVNLVGSRRMGDMADNDFEAHGGYTIKSIHDAAKEVVPTMQPNVVLVAAGANNVYQLADLEHADEHLENLINYLIEASPRVTIVMATLLLSLLPDCVPLNDHLNKKYRELYQKLEGQNKPVVLAELHPSTGLPGRPEAPDIGADGAHPTDEGYVKMGNVLAEAIKEADRKGFLQRPVENGIPADGDAEGEPRIGLPQTSRRRHAPRIQKRAGWCQPSEERRIELERWMQET